MAGERLSARVLAERMAEEYYAAHGRPDVPAECREPFAAMLMPVAEMATEVLGRLDAHAETLAGLLMRDAEARGELGADWPASLPSGEAAGEQ